MTYIIATTHKLLNAIFVEMPDHIEEHNDAVDHFILGLTQVLRIYPSAHWEMKSNGYFDGDEAQDV